VFLGIGATLGRGLDIEGAGADGVFKAIEFLINMNRGFQVERRRAGRGGRWRRRRDGRRPHRAACVGVRRRRRCPGNMTDSDRRRPHRRGSQRGARAT
jgi:hypothetical protein